MLRPIHYSLITETAAPAGGTRDKPIDFQEKIPRMTRITEHASIKIMQIQVIPQQQLDLSLKSRKCPDFIISEQSPGHQPTFHCRFHLQEQLHEVSFPYLVRCSYLELDFPKVGTKSYAGPYTLLSSPKVEGSNCRGRFTG